MDTTHLFRHRLWQSQDLDAGGTLVSPVIDCTRSDPEYLLFRISNGSGAADAKIEFVVSFDGVTFNSYDSQDPIVASTNTEFTGKNPEELHLLTCPGAPFLKLRVTELGGLNNNVVDCDLWMRE